MRKFKWAYYSIKGEIVSRTADKCVIHLIAPGEQGCNPARCPWMTDRLKEVFFRKENVSLHFDHLEYNNCSDDDVNLYFDIRNENW